MRIFKGGPAELLDCERTLAELIPADVPWVAMGCSTWLDLLLGFPGETLWDAEIVYPVGDGHYRFVRFQLSEFRRRGPVTIKEDVTLTPGELNARRRRDARARGPRTVLRSANDGLWAAAAEAVRSNLQPSGTP